MAASSLPLQFAIMSAETRQDAFALLNTFLRGDEHYLASSTAYGDGGPEALHSALDLFLSHSELGFVWLGSLDGEVVSVCVVSKAISTSAGGIVAKLDDVFVIPPQQGRGIASEMLRSLALYLRRCGYRRIDTSVHLSNSGAARFYSVLGFQTLGEERLSLVL